MNFTAPYLSTITAQTLIVNSDRDPLYPVNIPLEIFTAIPRAYLWIIPNGGHAFIFGNMTDHFVETALVFFAANVSMNTRLSGLKSRDSDFSHTRKEKILISSRDP